MNNALISRRSCVGSSWGAFDAEVVLHSSLTQMSNDTVQNMIQHLFVNGYRHLLRSMLIFWIITKMS